jgi:hypothetical protein
MGAAAAMQALKMFSGGQSGNTQQGNSQNAFIGMAMAEAGKVSKVLFYSLLHQQILFRLITRSGLANNKNIALRPTILPRQRRFGRQQAICGPAGW